VKAPPSDAGLLRSAAAGDQSAFRDLVDRHAASVHRFLRSLGANPDDTEDAVQECFISAWKSAATFRGGESARPWLFAIARNAFRRLDRKRVGEPQHFESIDELGERAGWGAGADFTAELEAVEELQWALAHLPAEEREVVVARDIEGLTGVEAAAALETSVAAMKSRLHRGRLRLMATLRERSVTDA